MNYRLLLFTFFYLLGLLPLRAQRSYAPHSVLASGEWFKVSISESGAYKIDAAFLKSMGFSASTIQTTAVRVFGNGGASLPEACSGVYTDDLQELAVQTVDDGDGIFNNNDYLLFYADGPDQWFRDSVNRRFSHQRNLYDNRAYYYVTIGGLARQIEIQSQQPAATTTVREYDARDFHELDTVNFLSSGKQWYGEEFGTSPGVPLSRNFAPGLQQPVAGRQVYLVSSCISRSFTAGSSFRITTGNQVVASHAFASVGTTNLDVYARESITTGSFEAGAPLTYSYTPGSSGSQGWLNWFEIFYRAELSLRNLPQLLFRDWVSVGAGSQAAFYLKDASAASRVWDITQPARPVQMRTALSGTELRFTNEAGRLREYIAFQPALAKVPLPVGKVANQDLHALPQVPFLIITTPALQEQAGKIASFHQQRNQLSAHVIPVNQIFNEFASGLPDPTAVRNLVKMFFDRGSAPKYLLFLGNGTYNYKSARLSPNVFVPAYESLSSLDPLSTYTSDDFFGFLQDEDDINQPGFKTLDIGIGRIPARSVAEADNYIAKLNRYADTASLGPWRNEITLIADDEDFNLHLHDAEAIAAVSQSANPVFHQNKIYLDAYKQESNASGSRYPLVNAAVKQRIDNGTLIWNYSGHGGFRRLAEEVVLDADVLDTWNNAGRLPLFITATCDFAPFDNPANFSLGENALLRPSTGAIALMTTTRLVFAASNRIINSNYLQAALARNPDGSYPSLGEAVLKAKNNPATNQSEVLNNLKFTLLGDPALTLAFPKYQVVTDLLNNVPPSAAQISALQSCTLQGSVRDAAGNILGDFNGMVYTRIYDKPDSVSTLGNDPQSLVERFPVQQRLLFKGLTEVKNGRFEVRFIVPKDLDYRPGKGIISYYATNGKEDGNGSFTDLEISGTRPPLADLAGPVIKAYLNAPSFTDGATTGPTPRILLHLSDSSGINITGSAIGHDLVAIVDDDPNRRYVLNDYFEPVLNSSNSGMVNFVLPALAPGAHKITITAWDIANNSSRVQLNFIVTADFTILKISAYPNPFRNSVTISFLPDQVLQEGNATVEIFNSAGLPVKFLGRTINNMNSRSNELVWDGKTESGMPAAPGIYIYRVILSNGNGRVKIKSGKFVRLP